MYSRGCSGPSLLNIFSALPGGATPKYQIPVHVCNFLDNMYNHWRMFCCGNCAVWSRSFAMCMLLILNCLQGGSYDFWL